MNELVTFSILTFTSFFTLINPLGTMPIFMTMTADLDQQHRTNTARKASIVAFFTIVFFAFSGQVLFNFFGISVNSFRIVGGVIFFLMGMDMLEARLGKVKIKESEVRDYRHQDAKRKNIPPAGLAAHGRTPQVAEQTYFYNPHLPPVLRFDDSGKTDALPELLETARSRALTAEESQFLAEVLRIQEPWLEWAGKRETKYFQIDPEFSFGGNHRANHTRFGYQGFERPVVRS